MSIEIPTNGAREYLRVYGVAAIYVAATPDGVHWIIGMTRDLGRTREAFQARCGLNVEYQTVYWVRDVVAARAIMGDVTAREIISLHAVDMPSAIVLAAVGRNITLTPHAVVMAKVHSAVSRVDNVIEQAHRGGRLQWFNAAYRGHRLATKATGMSYRQARARLRNALVRHIASGRPLALTPDLLVEIFPPERQAAVNGHGLNPAWPMLG